MTYYAMTDNKGCVVDIRTDEQISNVNPDVWHAVEDGGEYINNLYDENSICRYKLADGVITERTAEETAGDMPEPGTLLSGTEELEAQVTDLQMALCELYEEVFG